MTTTRDSIVDAERWLAGVPVEGSSALCVIGLGQGYLLDALDQRGWRGRVVALEPDASSSREGLDRPEVQAWLTAGRLTILAGPAHDGLERALLSIELTAEQPVIVVNPAVAHAHREQAVQAARLIGRAWFGARANQQARRDNGGRYLLNTLRNARAIAAEGDAAALAGVGVGVPAIVVGAGPSLDRNLPDIATYRDRALIIAADTSLRPLLSAGVHPDLVVALDPTETNARHLTDLPPCPNTYLVAEGSLDPEALPHFAGRTFFFNVSDHHPWPWLRSLGIGRGRLRAWGSVLTTAFDLSLVMGCNPILFAGADLAFTGGRPYARGTTYEEVWRRAEMWGQPIADCWTAAIEGWPDTREIGVTGDMVRTAPHLRSFRDWIAGEAAKVTGRAIVNGTGAGILLGTGIVQRPLAEALASLPVLESDAHGRVAATRQSTVRALAPVIHDADAATLATWQEFAGEGIDGDAMLHALGRLATPVASVDPVAVPERTVEPELPPGEVIFDCLPDVDLPSAIANAWQGMNPADHRLILRDRTGSLAGASVRRALFAFLERHPEVTARFGRFFDPNDDRSWIDRRPVSELLPGEDRDKWQDHHADVANRLTPMFVQHLAPASVIDIGCGAGHWLRAFAASGVADVTGVETSLDRFAPARSYDLCLCLGVVQSLTMAAAKDVIAACTKASDTVLFAVPAAAIGVPGFLTERPAGIWAGLFAEHGFAAHDELRPSIENQWGGYQTSYDLVTVYRRVMAHGETMPAAMRTALVASASRIDDLVLQFLLNARAATAAARPPARPHQPRLTTTELEILPARMEAADADGARRFGFRTVAGALALSAGIESITVTEDRGPVTFARQQDAITFRSSDGTDPRRNGRRYAVAVPAHIAWLEQQPLATIIKHRL